MYTKTFYDFYQKNSRYQTRSGMEPPITMEIKYYKIDMIICVASMLYKNYPR